MSSRADRAPLFEVFSSIQGEATHVGERHLFVRLAGCDLDCGYCDTPASRRIPARARVFFPDGVREIDNPVARDELDELLVALDEAAGPHHLVAITGGEPLLFTDYLAPLFRRWRGRGWRTLLETGGHRPDDLAAVVGLVDVVMADVKVRSAAGLSTPDDVNRRFLRLAARVECAVKAVVAAATTADEVERVARMVADEAPDAPLILQPVSGSRFGPPSGDHLLSLQRAAMRVHRDTRVIPQTHRSLHLR
ncbi:MAG: 7-carboxy-7-deazaguanine synthase QueE [Planctomycetota bacterium]|nr:7-carboxy-7-deazaguanine synthase QueE [Planctomycetota bacterium]